MVSDHQHEHAVLSDPSVLLSVAGRDSLDAVVQLEVVVESPEDQHLEEIGSMLPNLRELRLSKSRIVSTRCLGTSLTSLCVLWLGRCSVSDLSGCSALVNLRELYAPFNDIADVTPLAQCELLDILDLEGNEIGKLENDDEDDDDVDEETKIDVDERVKATTSGTHDDATCAGGAASASASRAARRLQAKIDASGLSFLHFCSGLTTLNLTNNPVSAIHGRALGGLSKPGGCDSDRSRQDPLTSLMRQRGAYRRSVVDIVPSLEVLDDEEVTEDDRVAATTAAAELLPPRENDDQAQDTGGADARNHTATVASDDHGTSSKPYVDESSSMNDLVDAANLRKEMVLVSNAIKHAHIDQYDEHEARDGSAGCVLWDVDNKHMASSSSSPSSSASNLLPSPPPSRPMTSHHRAHRPSSARAIFQPSSSSSSGSVGAGVRRQRPSTAFIRRPSSSRGGRRTGSSGVAAARCDDEVNLPGLYWRKNHIKSSLVDFSVSGKGSHAAEAANDNSDLTHGADAEAICGNPVRGLRARRTDGRSSSGQQDDPGAAAAGDDGVARKTSPIDKLDIIEELRRWKMQTAEKVDQINLSDDEGDEEDELVFSESATADAGRIGRHSNGIVNVLRIPRDVNSDGQMLPTSGGAATFPLADIDSNMEDGSNAPGAGVELPVGRLRPKFSKQNGFLGQAKTVPKAW